MTKSAQFDIGRGSYYVPSEGEGKAHLLKNGILNKIAPQVTEEGERLGHFLSADDFDEGVVTTGKNKVYNCNHSQLADHDYPSGADHSMSAGRRPHSSSKMSNSLTQNYLSFGSCSKPRASVVSMTVQQLNISRSNMSESYQIVSDCGQG